MNTFDMSITPKAIQDLLDELKALIKAKPIACLERFATTSFGTLRGWKRCDPATGPEDVRCRGRNLGTCIDEILSDSKRGDKEFVLLGPPLS